MFVSMLRRVAGSVFLWSAVALLRPCYAESGPDPAVAERLQKLAALNSLDAPDMKPWHLKVSYQLFDRQGKPAEQGVAEEWWSGERSWRLEVTQGGTVSTWLTEGEESYRSKGASYVSTEVSSLLQQIVHPIDTSALSRFAPEHRNYAMGKTALDCIMVSQPLKTSRGIPLGLFPTYCTGKDSDLLRYSSLNLNLSFVSNKMGRFQGHIVATMVDGMSTQAKFISGQVDKLEMIPATDVHLDSGDLERISLRAARISSGVMAGNILEKHQPVYPESSKSNQVSGTVVLHAIIGADGLIHSLNVVSSPDGDLSVAALAAVQTWRYKPYLLNGKPMDVETTIMVNFALNRY